MRKWNDWTTSWKIHLPETICCLSRFFFLQTPYISKIWNNNENIMTEMSKKEIKKFLIQRTLPGKLATVKKDGSPHVVPIWFIVDDDNDNGKRNSTEGEVLVRINPARIIAEKDIARWN